nr:hypothetical protein [Sphingobium sp. TCM1]
MGAVGQIEQYEVGEREIPAVDAKMDANRLHHVRSALRLEQCCGQIVELLDPSFADDPARLLADNAHKAFHGTVAADERTVGKGVIGLFQVAVTLEEQEQLLVPGRDAIAHDRHDTILDGLEHFVPDLRHGLAQRGGMF